MKKVVDYSNGILFHGEINGSGCCFDECPANCMTYCSDGHLFCLNCARMNAETVVGNGGYLFKCMDVSGCKAEFTTDEVARFVDAKTLALRDKLESENAIREVFPFESVLIKATIEGFVACPFCDYGAIIEDDNDKEFRCQNKECGIISCRSCRAESHIPLSCEGSPFLNIY
jgi:E3 ubiquitin-protein ligase RNF216